MPEVLSHGLRVRVLAALALVSALPAGPPVQAHHSAAQFDRSVEMTIEGTLVEFEWRNPHVYLTIGVPGADGRLREQRVEAGPAATLAPWGVGADSVRAGERVRVRANPNHRGADRMAFGVQLIKADGSVLPLHVSGVGATAPGDAQATGIFGVWVPEPSGILSLAAAVRAWPLTDRARRAIAETAAARQSARSECVAFGPPTLMVLPVAISVEQRDDTVVFSFDGLNARRTVYLGERERPSDPAPAMLGHSIGRWEGATLVVDTAGFSAHPEGYGFDLPSSAARRTVERFSLSEDRRHLDYEVTVSDAEYLEAPVTHRGRWQYRPGLQPAGTACDPEVARRFTMDE